MCRGIYPPPRDRCPACGVAGPIGAAGGHRPGGSRGGSGSPTPGGDGDGSRGSDPCWRRLRRRWYPIPGVRGSGGWPGRAMMQALKEAGRPAIARARARQCTAAGRGQARLGDDGEQAFGLFGFGVVEVGLAIEARRAWRVAATAAGAIAPSQPSMAAAIRSAARAWPASCWHSGKPFAVLPGFAPVDRGQAARNGRRSSLRHVATPASTARAAVPARVPRRVVVHARPCQPAAGDEIALGRDAGCRSTD